MTETTTGDTICPITLESIDPLHVFTHSGVSFDIFALYTYVTKTVVLLNPVTRTPFELADVIRMEEMVKTLCGDDAVIYTENDTIQASQTLSRRSSESTFFFTENTNTSSSELTLQCRVLSPDADRLRLEVDVGGFSTGLSDQSTTSDLTDSNTGSEDGDEEYFNEKNLEKLSSEDLPPKRWYPSVVEIFQDKQRLKNLKETLDILQFLYYDSTDILLQILNLLGDDQFHQMVWEQTYPVVFDAITQVVRERSTEVVDVEVTFSDCWETYRLRVITALLQRYTEIIHEVKRVDSDEAQMFLSIHTCIVTSDVGVLEERKHWLLDTIRRLQVHWR